MKQFAYLTMLVACALALFSCKSGGGGGKSSGGKSADGATQNEMVVANDTTSDTTSAVKETAPDTLLSGHWYFYKKGESRAFLAFNGSATPSGVFAISGGSEENKFVDGPGYRATYKKTGADRGILYLSYNHEEDIEERYLAGVTPITHIPSYGTRVVGTKVTKYYMEIEMKFDFAVTSNNGKSPVCRGEILSLTYKVDGVPYYTLSGGTFSNS